MKFQSIQKLFAFIITIMILSVVPELVTAQCGGWGSRPCPKGYTCLYGYCVKKNHGNGHGLVDNTPTNYLLSASGIRSTAINFELTEAQKVSLKIYDATGRLVKTIIDSRILSREHQIEWNVKDENDNPVQAGVYFLRMKADNYTEAKKILIVK